MTKKKILILFSVLFLLVGGIQPHYIVTNVQAEETKSSNDFITYLLMLMMSRGITFNAQSIPDLEKYISSAWGAYVVSQSLDDKKSSIESGVSYGNSKVSASSESYYYASGFVNSLTGHYLSESVNTTNYTVNDFIICSPGSKLLLFSIDPLKYSSTGGGTVWLTNNSDCNFYFFTDSHHTLYLFIPPKAQSNQCSDYSLSVMHHPASSAYAPVTSFYSSSDRSFQFRSSSGEYLFNASRSAGYFYVRYLKITPSYNFSLNDFPSLDFDEKSISYTVSNLGSSARSIDAVVPGSLRQLDQPKSIDSDKVYEQQLKGILQGANSADQIIDKLADQVAQKLTATIGDKSVSISYPVTVEGDYVVSVPQELKQAIPTAVPTNVPSSIPSAVPTAIPTIAPDAGSDYALKSVTSVFPFCIPYDVLELAKVLDVSAQAPSWDVPFKISGVIDTSIHLGFEDFDTVNKVSRTCQIILFIIVLIVATRNLIGNG